MGILAPPFVATCSTRLGLEIRISDCCLQNVGLSYPDDCPCSISLVRQKNSLQWPEAQTSLGR
jgi:hypothetical protein